MKKLLLCLLLSCNVYCGDLPNPQLTPGAVFDVPLETLCVSGYTSTVRDVPMSLKKKVYKSYGLSGNNTSYCAVEDGCEVDHLVNLGIGGSNSIKNLWPQPYSGSLWNARKKDALENKLRRLVCSKQLDIKVAQDAISKNWIEAYKKYVQIKK
jgi:hypothetical protein